MWAWLMASLCRKIHRVRPYCEGGRCFHRVPGSACYFSLPARRRQESPGVRAESSHIRWCLFARQECLGNSLDAFSFSKSGLASPLKGVMRQADSHYFIPVDPHLDPSMLVRSALPRVFIQTDGVHYTERKGSYAKHL